MTAVHQFLPTFEPGAIGNHAVQVQRTLRAAGYESHIFAEHVRPAFADLGIVHTDYGTKVKADADDLLIYHVAIGSVVADFLNGRSERLMIDHHNITPVEFYQPWDPSVTYGMAWGRNQLRQLAARATASIADSEYNRRELEDLHYKDTSVVPILLDFGAFDHAVDDAALSRMLQAKEGGGADWLFVGWVSPHKAQHDIIRAFAVYKKLYDPDARLHLVGRIGTESYADACAKLISELGLELSAFMHGGVTDGELGAFYRVADILVSMSEHEGVGIPLLEAMHHGVPVVAYAAAAVPETVGDAGLVLPRKRPATVAAAVSRVVSDEPLRNALIRRAKDRMALFALAKNEQRLLEAVRSATR